MIDAKKYQPAGQNMKFVTLWLRSLEFANIPFIITVNGRFYSVT
jgi:hypothetical protein